MPSIDRSVAGGPHGKGGCAISSVDATTGPDIIGFTRPGSGIRAGIARYGREGFETARDSV